MIEFISKQRLLLYFKLTSKNVAKKCVQKIFFINSKYISSYQGFKELQYVDLQLDLQRIKTCKSSNMQINNLIQNLKSGKIFFQIKYFQFYLDLCLIFWFTSLRALFIWKSGYVTSIVSITHTVIFSKQEVLRRWAVHKTTVSQISFQSISFKITKKHIALLKIVKNSGQKL